MRMEAGRALAVVACVAGLVSISACSPPPPPDATPSTTEVSTSAPSGVSEEELRAWVEAAQLSPDVVGAVGPIQAAVSMVASALVEAVPTM
jgi:hypothetical protein